MNGRMGKAKRAHLWATNTAVMGTARRAIRQPSASVAAPLPILQRGRRA
jgi:hypothetical protein